MTPYHDYVSALERLAREGRSLPLGGFPPRRAPAPAPDAPRVLVFSPHPDDECIIGGLALRLQREAGMRAVNVAVTQGSSKARQAARWAELRAACDYLGIDLLPTADGGLQGVNLASRGQDPARWRRSVEAIAAILDAQRPAVVFFPHADDWNSTHIGTHHLLMDALAAQPPAFACHVVETEFWGAMADPNLMVEIGADDLGHMMAALSFHEGEVRRNPYHLLVPAWMQDNVRRGGELVGGQGGAAPDFTFCTLYRVRRWQEGRLEPLYQGGRAIAAGTNAAGAFGR